MRARDLLPLVACLAAISSITPAKAGSFTSIFAFGDSLSDAGNVFIATGGAIPAPPYVGGHFSNGPTWVEDLSQSLGLGTLTPSLAGGTDFAFGGAVTGPAVPGATPTAIPTITQQVGLFNTATLGHAPSSALYTVWIGSNDVFQALADVGGGLSPATAKTDLANAAQTAAAAINTLASEGAKTFIVPLVPDLGKTPTANGNPITALAATALSAAYDTALVTDVSALAASDGITVHFLDTFSLIDNVVADPTAFGYTDVTDPCYTGPFTGGGSACSDPNSFLFWDLQHPTEPGHQAIAALALAEIPAPSTLSTLMVAGLFLLMRRRFSPR
jgi:phospholipase/lecithinase/hemolysin